MLTLVPRTGVSRRREIVTPLAAFAVALAVFAVVLLFMGRSPVKAFQVYILESLTSSWSLQEVILKATPLTLIAIGLLFAVRANRWNIGAEGQYVVGGIFGGAVAIWSHGNGGFWILPAMLIAGTIGGMLYGLIPAMLRNRFGISEILSSLMLVYVAELMLDYMVRGPWRDPRAFNFPKSVNFDAAATLGPIIEGGKLHWGVTFALIAVIAAYFLLGRSLFGFAVSATGEAPKAANFAGFNEKWLTLAVFAISGGLAGLAGIIEVSAQIGQLQPSISQGYGFTAIIIAFLGRLTPVGALLSALVLAMLLIGSEAAQITLKLPFDMTRAFMGLLLLCVLAGEALTRYRLEWRR
ncbi:MAG TPA: ABC transporter permease [Beijerinckiaceae bacterium]|nr:ABC transporter permease [Beijerinckiaceae bacterium]